MERVVRLCLFAVMCTAVPCLVLSLYQHYYGTLVQQASTDFFDMTSASVRTLVADSSQPATATKTLDLLRDHEQKAAAARSTFDLLSEGMRRNALLAIAGWTLVIILCSVMLLLAGRKRAWKA